MSLACTTKKLPGSIVNMVRALMLAVSFPDAVADSNGKPPPGLLQGSVADLGNYDECLDVVVTDLYDQVDFTGQYCNLFINPRGVPFVKKLIGKFHQKGELTVSLGECRRQWRELSIALTARFQIKSDTLSASPPNGGRGRRKRNEKPLGNAL